MNERRKPKPTPATLDEALQERGSAMRLAEALNVSPSWISELRSGLKVPSLSRAVAISRLTGVPVESLLPRRAA